MKSRLREWWKKNSSHVTIVAFILILSAILMMPTPEWMGDMFPETPHERCDKECVAKGFESGRYDSEMFQTFEECWCYDNGNVTQIW